MGNGEWGMGHGAWGDEGAGEAGVKGKMPNAQYPMPIIQL